LKLAFFAANRPPGRFIGIATRGHTIEETRRRARVARAS
jgi:hypothetical protein